MHNECNFKLGNLVSAKKRRKLTVLQKFRPFELALVIDHAVADDFLAVDKQKQKLLTARTEMQITELANAANLNSQRKKTQDLVRAVLMETLSTSEGAKVLVTSCSSVGSKSFGNLENRQILRQMN